MAHLLRRYIRPMKKVKTVKKNSKKKSSLKQYMYKDLYKTLYKTILKDSSWWKFI